MANLETLQAIGERSVAWSVYTAALLLLATLLIRAISGRHRQLNLPPGPKPWPIIGNFNLIGSLPHRSLDTLSKKYGPIMQLWFGSHLVVVASSVEMAEEFLKTHDLALASRPSNAAGKHLFFDRYDIFWAPYGPNWRQFRKICVTDLFSAKRVDSYKYIRVEELKSMISRLFASAGKPTVLREHLFTLTLGIISRMVMMKSYVDEAPGSIMKPKEFKEMVEEIRLLAGLNSMGDYFPLINFLDLQGNLKRMKAVRKKLDKFLDQVLNDHRINLKDSSTTEDMVDVLLQLSHATNLDVKLTPTQVKAFIVDMLIGGTETSVDTMEWAMVELIRSSKTMDKAVEELDMVIGKDRWAEEKDLPQLPYIEAIVKEATRMHPSGPLLAPHFAQDDCKIAGYEIPAGTIALVNVWTLGRDPRSWDMPDEFHPERFMGKKIDVKGQDFELLPFGSGRRMCPGYGLALKVVQLSLANLIHGFVWNLPENTSIKEMNMEETFGLTTHKKESLVAIVKPRLADLLYSM